MAPLYACRTVCEQIGHLDAGEHELNMWDSRYMAKSKDSTTKRHGLLKPSCVPVTFVILITLLIIILPAIHESRKNKTEVETANVRSAPVKCTTDCRFLMAETVPYESNRSKIETTHGHQSWIKLLDMARNRVDIISSDLRLRTAYDPDDQNLKLFHKIVQTGKKRGVSIRIILRDVGQDDNDDIAYLLKSGAAVIRRIGYNYNNLTVGSTTHFWIVDGRHAYIDSGNMDLTKFDQNLGLVFYNCSCIGRRLSDIFENYWLHVASSKRDSRCPTGRRESNSTVTIPDHSEVTVNLQHWWSNCQVSTENEASSNLAVDSIATVINRADRFVFISVVDYLPLIFSNSSKRYWSTIDDKLRRVAIDKGVAVRILLANCVTYSSSMILPFLESLAGLSSADQALNIKIKTFRGPKRLMTSGNGGPTSTENNSKYVVTDKTVYFGSSGWSGEILTNQDGLSLVIESSANESFSIREQLQKIFEDTWDSPYSELLTRTFDVHL